MTDPITHPITDPITDPITHPITDPVTELTLLDGGMGKELRRIGAPFRQPEWSALALLESPLDVVRAHANFIEAGAQVIISNNYAVVPYHLGDDLVATRGAELTALAGRLARTAADDAGRPVRVAGSLPPLFGSYEPDLFDPDRAPGLYAMIVDALGSSVDMWIAETLSTIGELHAVADAVAQGGGGRPLWVGFTLPDAWSDGAVTHRSPLLRSGESIDELVDAVAAHGQLIEAVLFNCSMPEQTGPALRLLRDALRAAGLDLPFGGYANAFPATRENDYAANETIIERRADLTPSTYADFVGEWIADGATIIGGCCDIYPEHIAELHRRFVRVRA